MTPSQALRRAAQKLAGVEIGVACEGTKLEKTTAKVGGKAFVFLGADDAMVKLAASIDEAKKLGYAPGKSGWTTVAPLATAPLAAVTRWVEESYNLLACPPTSAGSSVRASRGTTTGSSRPRPSKARTRSPANKRRSR